MGILERIGNYFKDELPKTEIGQELAKITVEEHMAFRRVVRELNAYVIAIKKGLLDLEAEVEKLKGEVQALKSKTVEDLENMTAEEVVKYVAGDNKVVPLESLVTGNQESPPIPKPSQGMKL